LIDLNRADRTELMLLDGIGPELADRIVEYRRQHGPFDGLADVRKVGGIGPMTLERMRPRVTLSWGAVPPKTSPAAEVSIEPASLVVLNEATRKESLPTLDPNRATLAELDTLPGIGPKLAQRIVDERAKSPFRQVSDLRRVAGIGTKTLEKIAPRLRFGGEVDSRVQ
jgi:competence ComEA-like helix-hairpin-helix protein